MANPPQSRAFCSRGRSSRPANPPPLTVLHPLRVRKGQLHAPPLPHFLNTSVPHESEKYANSPPPATTEPGGAMRKKEATLWLDSCVSPRNLVFGKEEPTQRNGVFSGGLQWDVVGSLSAPFRFFFCGSVSDPFRILFGSLSDPFRILFGSFSDRFRILSGHYRPRTLEKGPPYSSKTASVRLETRLFFTPFQRKALPVHFFCAVWRSCWEGTASERGLLGLAG